MGIKMSQTEDGYDKVQTDKESKTALYKKNDLVSYGEEIYVVLGVIVTFSTNSDFTFYYKLIDLYSNTILEKVNENKLSPISKKTLKFKIKSSGT